MRIKIPSFVDRYGERHVIAEIIGGDLIAECSVACPWDSWDTAMHMVMPERITCKKCRNMMELDDPRVCTNSKE